MNRILRSEKIGGNGLYCHRFSVALQRKIMCRFAIPVTSCTAALEMALFLIGLKPGDEVICPSFAFVSTANAIVRQNGVPVFVDINEETFNIDENKIEQALSVRTRAIMVVHYAGMACAMDKIMTIAKRRKLIVIEDAAQALGAKYRSGYLGTIGDMGCFSFHETKNIVCGEGGAFVTNAKKIYKSAEIYCEKGTNRSAFLRGEIDKYTWVGEGTSLVLSDLLSGLALVQVRKMDKINKLRARNANSLLHGLAPFQAKIKLPSVPPNCTPNWHLFAIRVNKNKRNTFIKALKDKGVGAAFHFVPLHSSPFYKKRFPQRRLKLPNTEKVCQSLVRLPLYPQMDKKNIDYIIKTVASLVKML